MFCPLFVFQVFRRKKMSDNFGDWFNKSADKIAGAKTAPTGAVSADEVIEMFGSRSVTLPTDKMEKRKFLSNAILKMARSGTDSSRIADILIRIGLNTKQAAAALRYAKEQLFEELVRDNPDIRISIKEDKVKKKAFAAFKRNESGILIEGMPVPLSVLLGLNKAESSWKRIVEIRKSGSKRELTAEESREHSDLINFFKEADRTVKAIRERIGAAMLEVFPAKRGRGYDAFADLNTLELSDGDDF